MPVTVGAPRQLLRRLREVMAERESAQIRLDKVVVLIASNMVAEVCSLYLQRRDGSFELFATEGLNPAAVHNTFNLQRHLISAQTHRALRGAAMTTWRTAVAAA